MLNPILFFAKFPEADCKKDLDGYAQRVLTIDRLFKNRFRIYVYISPERIRFPRVRIRNIKLWGIVFYLGNKYHAKCLRFLMRFVRLVYIHTAHIAVITKPYWQGKKVVFDTHGALSEEVKLMGQLHLYKDLHNIEKELCKNAFLVVNVTDSMTRYLTRKHSLKQLNALTIANFDDLKLHKCPKTKKKKPLIIYSGGMQQWQNVPTMIKAVSKLKDKFSFIILTPNKREFKNEISGKIPLHDIVIKTVTQKETYEYYKKADFGFILREDNIVNQVACPTKLVEYISYGIIPIVLQPDIGDFRTLGYKYILLEDLLKGFLPSHYKQNEMRKQNYGVLKEIYRSTLKKSQKLLDL